MPVESPPFRIWLRRMSSLERTFALRFEAFEGKGVLRVARPGVLVDPPARVSGYESDITAQNVRASRFLLAEAEEYPDPESFTPYAAVEMMPAMPDALQPAYVEELVPLEAEEAPDTDEELLGDESSDGTVSPDDYLSGEEDELVTEGLLAAGLAQIALVAAAPAEGHNGLVRHLRRQLSAAQAEIIALNAKIALLERKILASEMAPIALEEDTDEA